MCAGSSGRQSSPDDDAEAAVAAKQTKISGRYKKRQNDFMGGETFRKIIRNRAAKFEMDCLRRTQLFTSGNVMAIVD
jgi:hypothetical protein